MIKGSEKRHPQHSVNPLFVDRWSPRAMSGETVSEQELMTLFEAARWAPSSGNAQPWRMIYARRDTPHWPVFLGLLGERNQAWAQHAGALVLFASSRVNEAMKEPSRSHSLDTGAAWENFALQGYLLGLAVHGMQGFDYERARTELQIPESFNVEMMAAVGRPGSVERLPEPLKARESPNDRRPLAQTICEGKFGF
jgi:nitroreductase